LPALASGLEVQQAVSEVVRKIIVAGKLEHIEHELNLDKFDDNMLLAIEMWVNGINKKEILIESLLMPWTAVKNQPWLAEPVSNWK
jgi:superfamily II RNA helicase